MVKSPLTQSRRDALKAALVDAAEAFIRSDGHAELRARALADRVGCALGAIYNVFPDLDALIMAVKSRVMAALDHDLSRAGAIARAGSPDDKAAARAELLALAHAYHGFAGAQARLWRLLFEHRTPDPQVPDWYLNDLDQIFGHIDRPLALLLPAMPAADRLALGRGLFSAVHGVVALGLEEKLGDVPPALISFQLTTIVEAALAGLEARFGA